MLCALLEDENSIASMLINRAGGDSQALKDAAKATLDSLPKVTGASQLSLDTGFAKLLATAEKDAAKRGDAFIAADQLILTMAGANSSIASYFKK